MIGIFIAETNLHGSLDRFRHGDEADVRDAHAARDRAAAQIGGLKTGFLDESGRETVETAGRDQ